MVRGRLNTDKGIKHNAIGSDDPREVAAYIEQITGELSAIALDGQLPFLAYLIDMARLEAAEHATAAYSSLEREVGQ